MRKTLQALGHRLMVARQGLRWPDAAVQKQYTGTSGEPLLAKSYEFLRILEDHVPALEARSWRGLDYGVGWGRFASLLTDYGKPSQLDCVDAWDRSLELARSCGLQNSMTRVQAFLAVDELKRDFYDFIYAYSIFTHLPATHIENNALRLRDSLKPGGVLIFTVREPWFLNHLKRTDNYHPRTDDLSSSGHWFGNAHDDDYGDSIVSLEWMQKHLAGLGKLERIGPLALETTQCVMKLTRDDRVST